MFFIKCVVVLLYCCIHCRNWPILPVLGTTILTCSIRQPIRSICSKMLVYATVCGSLSENGIDLRYQLTGNYIRRVLFIVFVQAILECSLFGCLLLPMADLYTGRIIFYFCTWSSIHNIRLAWHFAAILYICLSRQFDAFGDDHPFISLLIWGRMFENFCDHVSPSNLTSPRRVCVKLLQYSALKIPKDMIKWKRKYVI